MANPALEKEIFESIAKSATSAPHNTSDKPPFMLINPRSGGKLIWMCDWDHNSKLQSVFYWKDNKTVEVKQIVEIKLKDALDHKKILLKEGWFAPTIKQSFTMPNGTVIESNGNNNKT